MNGAYSGYEIASIVLAAGFVVLIVATSVLCAAALGAYVVYKTKREDGAAFQLQESAGDASVAKGEYDDVDLPLGEDTSDRVMSDALDGALKQTQRFMQQQETIVRK